MAGRLDLDQVRHAWGSAMIATSPQSPAPSLTLSEILGAMSYALDLTEGQPPGHCLRSCFIGMQIGQVLGLSPGMLRDLYYTILLKDAGCSSNAARLCALYGSDDRAAKRDFKRIDSQNLVQVAGFVLSHTALGQGLVDRFRKIMSLARHGQSLASELVATRCERGAAIARQLGFNEEVAAGIHGLDEHWNGKGKPDGLQGDAIPLGARIALIAQVSDVFHTIGGRRRALAEVHARRGSWFDPDLVDALDHADRGSDFWAVLHSPALADQLRLAEPEPMAVMVDDAHLDSIATAFAQVVDSKSPYTFGHSARVTVYADAIAEQLGLSHDRRRWLRRGALLHDIGKLGVSNSILDKPAALTAEEWVAVRAHARYTEEILSRIGIFQELAVVAGAHHERLDGKGYPRGLKAGQIALETRIITTADIFDALTAERPYRKAIPIPVALSMMEKTQGQAIDPSCLAALKVSLIDLGAQKHRDHDAAGSIP